MRSIYSYLFCPDEELAELCVKPLETPTFCFGSSTFFNTNNDHLELSKHEEIELNKIHEYGYIKIFMNDLIGIDRADFTIDIALDAKDDKSKPFSDIGKSYFDDYYYCLHFSKIINDEKAEFERILIDSSSALSDESKAEKFEIKESGVDQIKPIYSDEMSLAPIVRLITDFTLPKPIELEPISIFEDLSLSRF